MFKASTKFKAGDKVKISKIHPTLQKMGMLLGHTYTLTTGEAHGLPHELLAYAHPEAWVAIIDHLGGDSGFDSYFELVEPKQEGPKPCTCESLTLFRAGCKCGAVTPRRWGLGA